MLFAVSDSVWNTLITTGGATFMAYLALRTEMIRHTQCKVRGELKEATVKSEERAAKLDNVASRVEELQQSIPPNWKP